MASASAALRTKSFQWYKVEKLASEPDVSHCVVRYRPNEKNRLVARAIYNVLALTCEGRKEFFD